MISRQADVELQITPKMEEAGENVVSALRSYASDLHLAVAVYTAMRKMSNQELD